MFYLKRGILNYSGSNPFITTWQTENAGSATKTIVIPTTGVGYDCYVDWGDSNVIHYTGTTPTISHVYSTTGIKTISISGTFPRIYFNNGGDKLKILTIAQWGTNAWTSMFGAFYGCTNLTGTYTDTPNTTAVASMQSMFINCPAFNSPVNFNTANVTDMTQMFYGCAAFNQSVAGFNTAKVTLMVNMFRGCTVFNQSVAGFNTAKVTDMSFMFYGCAAFNQSVSNFDTSLVTTMTYMFCNCAAFNQSVSNFNTSLVNTMSFMFNGCSNFNQSLTTFNLSTVTTMASMFSSNNWGTTNYNAALIAWDVAGTHNTVTFSAGTNKYTGGGAAAAARADLVLAVGSGGHGWTITDGGTV